MEFIGKSNRGFLFDSRSFYFLFLFLFLFLIRASAETNSNDVKVKNQIDKKSQDLQIPQIIPLGSHLELVANEHRMKCIDNLQNEYRNLIGRHVRGKNAVLVDTVDHPNVGDNIIQFGEIKLLKEFGIEVRSACSNWDCNLTSVAKQVTEYNGESVILIHGGGNLGDIWKSNTKFRFRVVQHFPTTPIVVLPQSIFYYREAEAYKEGRLYANHKNVTIYLRDFNSLSYSKKHFKGVPSFLCPDAAFMLGPLNASECKPRFDVFVLTRKDTEKLLSVGDAEEVVKELKRVNISAVSADWWDWKKFFSHRPEPRTRLDWAEWRMLAGKDLLCLGKVIVTDRLHAVILSTLIGLPHVYIDNNYKKVSSFVDSNLGRHEDCKADYIRGWKASSWPHAAKIAAAMFQKEL